MALPDQVLDGAIVQRMLRAEQKKAAESTTGQEMQILQIMNRLDFAAIRSQRLPIPCALAVGPRTNSPTRPLVAWAMPASQLSPSAATSSTDRCFFCVHVQQHLFRCFRSGSQLDLWVNATSLSLYPPTSTAANAYPSFPFISTIRNRETTCDQPLFTQSTGRPNWETVTRKNRDRHPEPGETRP